MFSFPDQREPLKKSVIIWSQSLDTNSFLVPGYEIEFEYDASISNYILVKLPQALMQKIYPPSEVSNQNPRPEKLRFEKNNNVLTFIKDVGVQFRCKIAIVDVDANVPGSERKIIHGIYKISRIPPDPTDEQSGGWGGGPPAP